MSDYSRIFKRFFLIASMAIVRFGHFSGFTMRSKDLLTDQVIAQARAHFHSIVLTRNGVPSTVCFTLIKRPGGSRILIWKSRTLRLPTPI